MYTRHNALLALHVPLENQTPPIFNSSLFIFICHHVSAVLHFVASPWNLCSLLHRDRHTVWRKYESTKHKFFVLRANWLKVAKGITRINLSGKWRRGQAVEEHFNFVFLDGFHYSSSYHLFAKIANKKSFLMLLVGFSS